MACADQLAANASHFAVHWAGAGGNIYVGNVGQPGRAPTNPPLLQAHAAPITDLALSPFDSRLLLSAGDDVKLKIWRCALATSAPGLRSPTAHICTGTGLTLPTSAPGLRAPSPNPRTCPSLTASCHVAAVLQVGRGGRNEEHERVRGGNSSAALTRQLALVPPDCRLALRCDVP